MGGVKVRSIERFDEVDSGVRTLLSLVQAEEAERGCHGGTAELDIWVLRNLTEDTDGKSSTNDRRTRQA